nr:methyltransferase [uncultured Moellerella sp.]
MTSTSRILKKSRQDDRAAADITLNWYSYSAMLVGHRMGIFKSLEGGPKTLADICNEFDLQKRAAEVLLSVGTSLDFVVLTPKGYALTHLGEDALLESSPTYFGDFWDMVGDNSEGFSLDGLERAFRQNKPQVYDNKAVYEVNANDLEKAKKFALGMNSYSIGAATTWPDRIDLSHYSKMLDVAGGSGVHSIGAVSRWPNLTSTIFDMAIVCKIAEENIKDYGLQDRITTHIGDMWKDPFPQADIHFYSQVFHDWKLDKNALLVKKSFDSLSSGGRIIIHELLYNDDKTGPLAAAGYSVMVLGWLEGERSTGRHLVESLRKAGFIDIEIIPSYGYNSMVTGIKP